MKLHQRIAVVLILLAIGFGLIWVVAKYIATPSPSGEVYRLVTEWLKLPQGVEIGQE